MVSHHNMVSPQNGDTQGGPPLPPAPRSDATECLLPLRRRLSYDRRLVRKNLFWENWKIDLDCRHNYIYTINEMKFFQTTYCTVQRRNRSGFSRPDPTGKFQNHRRLTGRSTGFWPARSTGFFYRRFFFHCSMYLMKNFQKGGMGEMLKFATLNEGLRKKTQKNFSFFCKNDSHLFWLSFGLNALFWAAQNVHKISIKSTGGHKLNY